MPAQLAPRTDAPDSKGFPSWTPAPEVLRRWSRWRGNVAGRTRDPEMETGASDSKYTTAAGIPTYGVNGVGIDQDDIRAHGKDERVRTHPTSTASISTTAS